MSYRSERFNDGMRSLDFESVMSDKNRDTSDKGLGVKRMIAALDYDSAAEDTRETTIRTEHEEKLFEAEMRLADTGKSYLIHVLLLIVENGANREESMKNVPRRTYFRHRKKLMKFFCGTRVHMDI